MRSEPVRYHRDGAVGWISIDYPPVNVLGAAVRAGLAMALESAIADMDTRAIVIACAGRTFSAGADIGEFGAPMREPSLQSVFAAIESAPKAVVAALHGTPLGGGLELALACHYRVAAVDTKMGLPEITLGVIPGAGGTQRLPRIVGALTALDLIVAGSPVDAATARRLGLIDAVIEGDLTQGVQHYCELLLDQNVKPRPTSARPVDTTGFDQTGIAAVLGKHSRALKGRHTQLLIVEAVTAATQPGFAAGLAVERRLADYSITTLESRALRHLFFAERQVAKALGVKLLRKVDVVASDAFGAIGNKMMLDGYWREAALLMLEGASPEQVDTAVESFGFATGPARVSDHSGGDIGPKTLPTAAVTTLIEQLPVPRRIEQRSIDAAEIVERCILQLINVGAQLLEAGIALRAADIDVVWVHGYGFPRQLGGPMFYADSLGLEHVLERVQHYRNASSDDHWKPAALLEQLAQQEKSFARWDSERTGHA